MDNIYYIGDIVFTKTPMSMTNVLYIFNGARQTDEGWTVTFTTVAAQGYAGGSSSLQFDVNVGDSLRLGAGCKASVCNPMKPNKAYVNKKADKLYFDHIERDMLQLSFDLL